MGRLRWMWNKSEDCWGKLWWTCCQERKYRLELNRWNLKAAISSLRILLQAGSCTISDWPVFHLNRFLLPKVLQFDSAYLCFGGSLCLQLFKPADFKPVQSWWQRVIDISVPVKEKDTLFSHGFFTILVTHTLHISTYASKFVEFFYTTDTAYFQYAFKVLRRHVLLYFFKQKEGLF